MRFQMVIEKVKLNIVGDEDGYTLMDNLDDSLIVDNLTYEQLGQVRALVDLMVNVSGYTVYRLPYNSPSRED